MGGSIVLRVKGMVSGAANTQILTTASILSPADDDPSNNSTTFRTNIILPVAGDTTIYRMDAIESTLASLPIVPNGNGTINLVFKLVSGPVIPSLGTTFTVPVEYSPLMNRTGNGVSYLWDSIGVYYDGASVPDFLTIEPNIATFFTNLPASNVKTIPKVPDGVSSDQYFQQLLADNTIEPLGTFKLKIGSYPVIPEESTSKLEWAAIYLHNNYNFAHNETDIQWGHYVSALVQPVTSNIVGFTTTEIVPVLFDNSYTYRFTAFKNIDVTPSSDENFTAGFNWANLAYGQLSFWTPQALPVTFAEFNASRTFDGILFEWTTSSETGNSHFELELSADGKKFVKVGEVISKAESGNSSLPLSYSFIAALPGGVALFSGLALMLLGAGGWMRRRNAAFVLVVLAGLALGIMGCSKATEKLLDHKEQLFARITQVDKDGTRSHSTMVKVIDKR